MIFKEKKCILKYRWWLICYYSLTHVIGTKLSYNRILQNNLWKVYLCGLLTCEKNGRNINFYKTGDTGAIISIVPGMLHEDHKCVARLYMWRLIITIIAAAALYRRWRYKSVGRWIQDDFYRKLNKTSDTSKWMRDGCFFFSLHHATSVLWRVVIFVFWTFLRVLSFFRLLWLLIHTLNTYLYGLLVSFFLWMTRHMETLKTC